MKKVDTCADNGDVVCRATCWL